MTEERLQWIDAFAKVGLDFKAICAGQINPFAQPLTDEQRYVLDEFGMCGE